MVTTAPAVVRLSVTVPNSQCPVCGASVYFYQSPYGGRVFFDELGPPGPKHPCTDNSPSRSASFVQLNKNLHPPKSPEHLPEWFRSGWAPVDIASVRQHDEYTVLTGVNASLGQTISFTIEGVARFTKDDPLLVRRCEDGSGSWDISYLPINSRFLTIVPETVKAFPNVRSAQGLQNWLASQDDDADAHNMVGMMLSFGTGKKSEEGTWTFVDDPDWAAAELHFLIAARQGCWAGYHNLGSMYRHGFGVNQSDELGFYFTTRAVEEAEDDYAASLSALKEMLLLGWGTPADRDAANGLIANLSQKEQSEGKSATSQD